MEQWYEFPLLKAMEAIVVDHSSLHYCAPHKSLATSCRAVVPAAVLAEQKETPAAYLSVSYKQKRAHETEL